MKYFRILNKSELNNKITISKSEGRFPHWKLRVNSRKVGITCVVQHDNSVKEAESIIRCSLKNKNNYSHVLWLPEEGKHMRIVKYVA
jgi:hypothetical protein